MRKNNIFFLGVDNIDVCQGHLNRMACRHNTNEVKGGKKIDVFFLTTAECGQKSLINVSSVYFMVAMYFSR